MSAYMGNLAVTTDRPEGGYCQTCKNPVTGEDAYREWCPICQDHTALLTEAEMQADEDEGEGRA